MVYSALGAQIPGDKGAIKILFHCSHVGDAITILFYAVEYEACLCYLVFCFSRDCAEVCTVACVFQVSSGREFQAILRFDTEVELNYFQHGGILNYMIRKMV